MKISIIIIVILSLIPRLCVGVSLVAIHPCFTLVTPVPQSTDRCITSSAPGLLVQMKIEGLESSNQTNYEIAAKDLAAPLCMLKQPH